MLFNDALQMFQRLTKGNFFPTLNETIKFLFCWIYIQLEFLCVICNND